MECRALHLMKEINNNDSDMRPLENVAGVRDILEQASGLLMKGLVAGELDIKSYQDIHDDIGDVMGKVLNIIHLNCQR